MQTNSLLAIIAYARAGALDFAWAQFRAGGFDTLDGDPAALTVKGRLLRAAPASWKLAGRGHSRSRVHSRHGVSDDFDANA